MKSVLISVVIATRNRGQLLEVTLEALAAQGWPRNNVEIIVADNGSTDATRAVVDAAAARPDIPTIRYLYVAEPGKSYAVNAALDIAYGEIVAFTDDDVRPDPSWLERLATAFEETGAAFVAGRVLPLWSTAPPPWMSSALHGVLAIPDNGTHRIEIAPGGTDQIVPIGANMAVRRSVVERIGGLRADLGKLEGSLRTGEDHEFFLRMLHAGYRGIYEPTAVVHHWVSSDRLERSYFRRWLYQNGRDVARIEASYPPSARRLFGVPRYLWRQVALDAWRTMRSSVRGTAATRFASATRMLWFAGYLRESWFGEPAPPADTHRPIARVSHVG